MFPQPPIDEPGLDCKLKFPSTAPVKRLGRSLRAILLQLNSMPQACAKMLVVQFARCAPAGEIGSYGVSTRHSVSDEAMSPHVIKIGKV
jgi:hypothetical protein